MRAKYDPTKNPVGSTGNGFELFTITMTSPRSMVHYLLSVIRLVLRIKMYIPRTRTHFVRTPATLYRVTDLPSNMAGFTVPEPCNYSDPLSRCLPFFGSGNAFFWQV
jgi:hypothetical protein